MSKRSEKMQMMVKEDEKNLFPIRKWTTKSGGWRYGQMNKTLGQIRKQQFWIKFPEVMKPDNFRLQFQQSYKKIGIREQSIFNSQTR